MRRYCMTVARGSSAGGAIFVPADKCGTMFGFSAILLEVFLTLRKATLDASALARRSWLSCVKDTTKFEDLSTKLQKGR